jgi:hypothetical protein
MRKRLEELCWQPQPDFPDNGESTVEVFASKPGDVVAGAPISLESQ